VLIFSIIKKCLFDQKKGKWVDEHPKVIWSHNTSESGTIRFAPFRLLYRAAAMSPEELKNKSLRAQSQEKETHPSNEADLIEFDILQAANNLSKYQQKTKKMEVQEGSRRDI
jgi:hypothetical protein